MFKEGQNMIKAIKSKFVIFSVISFLIVGAFAPASTVLAVSGDTIVYVTKTGECYHADGCSCLKKSKIETTLQEAVDDGYRACKKCSPGTLDSSSTTTSSSTKASTK
jgi:hypothetical protein